MFSLRYRIHELVKWRLLAVLLVLLCLSCTGGAGGDDVCSSGPKLTLFPSVFDCENNGFIEVQVEGGEGDISYAILPNEGINISNGRYNDLPPNTYTVFATDANGCQDQASADIGLVSFEDQVYFMFYMNCTYSGCHNAGTEGLANYRLFDNIKANANAILASVEKREMPPSDRDPLSDEEILALTCWVKQGAKFN